MCVCVHVGVWVTDILDEPLELLRFVCRAVVGGPGVSNGELVELEHVHDSHLGHGTAKQLWPLVHTGRYAGTQTRYM